MTLPYEGDNKYERTQSVIYRMQETLFNASRESRHDEQENTLAAKQAMHEEVDEKIQVNSTPILEYVQKNYKDRRHELGMLRYNAFKQGVFEEKDENKSGSFDKALPYIKPSVIMPEPFLPRMGTGAINGILTVILTCEDLVTALEKHQNLRVQNRELWGADIYTCDSDPLLALLHCGLLDFDVLGRDAQEPRRTPGNIDNPDDVRSLFEEGEAAKGNKQGFDVVVKLIMLPPLQRYPAVERHGVKSREWEQLHDGLSYGIHSIRVCPREE